MYKVRRGYIEALASVKRKDCERLTINYKLGSRTVHQIYRFYKTGRRETPLQYAWRFVKLVKVVLALIATSGGHFVDRTRSKDRTECFLLAYRKKERKRKNGKKRKNPCSRAFLKKIRARNTNNLKYHEILIIFNGG